MPRKLLVVDDSSTICEAVRYALAGEDWVVTAVASTAEAVRALAEDLPDAVLCDVALGREDGYETCRTLRAAAGGAELPVVLMGSKVSQSLAQAAGAAGVLAKPFQSDELAETLRASLEPAGLEPGGLTGGEDDLLSFEPALPPAWEAPGAGAPVTSLAGGEVEIIDLSDPDELDDLELLQDLEPLPAAAAAPGEPVPQVLGSAGLDLVDLAPSNEGAGLPEPPVSFEFDLADLAAAPATPGAAEGSMPAPEGPFPELDLGEADDLVQPTAEEGLTPGGEAEDLLGDLHLEPWTEEARGPSPTAPPPATPSPEDSEPWRGEQAADRLGSGGEAWAEPAGREATQAWLEEPAVEELETEGEWPSAEPGELETGTEPAPAAPSVDEFWAGPGPSQPTGADWDEGIEEAQPLRELAASTEDAVRRALEQSLSAQALAPLVAATVERVVWEVVPQLAERLIREAIAKLQEEAPTD